MELIILVQKVGGLSLAVISWANKSGLKLERNKEILVHLSWKGLIISCKLRCVVTNILSVNISGSIIIALKLKEFFFVWSGWKDIQNLFWISKFFSSECNLLEAGLNIPRSNKKPLKLKEAEIYWVFKHCGLSHP